MFYKKAELKRYRKYNGDKILKKNIYIWEKKLEGNRYKI